MAKPSDTRKETLTVPEEAYAPAVFSSSDAANLQALARGEANQLQQQQVLDWIIVHVCRTYDQPYRPAGPGDTAFACGRQFVGQQLVRVVKWRPPTKKGQDDDGRRDQR